MKYVIPRNIKVKETIGYGLNGKQMLFVGLGILGAVSVSVIAMPLDLRIASGIFSIGSGLAVSTAKMHGQDIDKYIVNSIKYPLRKKTFHQGEDTNVQKETIVRIRYNLA